MVHGSAACVSRNTTIALHHKLCHVLGGGFDLPHAETHAIVLPHATAYNAPAAPEAMHRIARALDGADAPAGLYALAQSLKIPLALKDIGMPEDGIERVLDLALKDPYWNPRPLEKEGIRALSGAPMRATRRHRTRVACREDLLLAYMSGGRRA